MNTDEYAREIMLYHSATDTDVAELLKHASDTKKEYLYPQQHFVSCNLNDVFCWALFLYWAHSNHFLMISSTAHILEYKMTN